MGYLGFSEDEEVESAPIDHQRPRKSLRPFIPELTLSTAAVSRYSTSPTYNPKPLPCFRPRIVPDAVDDGDDVDTNLTLSTAVSSTSTTSSPIYNPIPLRFFRPRIVPVPVPDDVVDGDDNVDTTLKLSTVVSSRNSTSPIYNPMPLRCFRPMMVPAEANEDFFTSLSLDPLPAHKRGTGKKRKRDDGIGSGKKRGKRINNGGDHEYPRPSIEEFPALVQALERSNRSRAVFLYRKKLEDSDARGDQNRLFVTRREPLIAFLTAEEAAAVDGSTQGLNILGVDQCGKTYNLGLKKWRSLSMTVINSNWNRMIAANSARKGDVVEIWGFRENDDGTLGFVIIFRS